MKTLCRLCNNATLINGEYVCNGGSKEKRENYEKQAREFKRYIKTGK